MGETTTAALPDLAWSRTFPGRAEFVREARYFVAGLMRGVPAAGECGAAAAGERCGADTDDAILCLSELAANAVAHSDSGKPGGEFTVRVAITGGDRVRVEVEDQGGRWACPPLAGGQHGRGLLIVCRLASNWGVIGDGKASRIVWFELAAGA
jgi:serine/threonine-protein kinase RsbW